MKPQEVSASIVVYKNDPKEVLAAITSAISAQIRIKQLPSTFDQLSRRLLGGPIKALSAAPSSRLREYHMQSAITYFGKWGLIYDSERRRLNENAPALAHDCAARERAA
jgi:hypothetical protein